MPMLIKAIKKQKACFWRNDAWWWRYWYPSEVSSCLKYCECVGIEPKLKPSRNEFVGCWEGKVPSVGSVSVRMLVGYFYLDLNIEMVNQDIPLIFGLDQQKLNFCSSNKSQNTFTHHPSRTTIPHKYKRDHLWVVWPVMEVHHFKVQSMPNIRC